MICQESGVTRVHRQRSGGMDLACRDILSCAGYQSNGEGGVGATEHGRDNGSFLQLVVR
jgi:hypothetical protein